jgi:hypothetical protein
LAVPGQSSPGTVRTTRIQLADDKGAACAVEIDGDNAVAVEGEPDDCTVAR